MSPEPTAASTRFKLPCGCWVNDGRIVATAFDCDDHKQGDPDPTAAQDRRFERLLYSELDAIQRDPSRDPDERLDAWREENRRLALTSVYTTEDEDV